MSAPAARQHRTATSPHVQYPSTTSSSRNQPSASTCSSYHSIESETAAPMHVRSESQATAAARHQQQQQQARGASPAPHASTPAHKVQHHQQQQVARPSLDPHTAATVIQATWRMYRLATHHQSLKQLASAAAQLRSISAHLRSAQQTAAAAGERLTQKQYLECSETVMKVLFLLDSVSCGSALELRDVRKRLSAEANRLLDEMQAAHKDGPAALCQQQQQHQ